MASDIRILHTADLHLDSPLRSLALRDAGLRDRVANATRIALGRIVETAIDREVAAVLIAGDLFDGRERSAHTAAFLLHALDRLRGHGIRVFLIRGNHDAENPVTGAIEWPDNVHLFSGRGGRVMLADGVWIHGVSFARPHAPESLLGHFPPPVPGAVNIAMLHSSLAGAPGHDVYAPCSVAELVAMGFDYWALGHVHKRSVHATAPLVVMPGTPQGRDIGEAGEKSATLLTIADGAIAIEEVPTAAVQFRHGTLDVTGIDSEQGLRERLRAHLREHAPAAGAPACVLRVVLRGQTALHWQIERDRDVWTEFATQTAREFTTLWIDRLLLELTPKPTAAAGVGAADELAGLIDTLRGELGFVAQARDEVDTLLRALPPEIRARLLPDETAMGALVERLARDGGRAVLARMRGAASSEREPG